ncbi:A24 family peptidase [Streptomyces kunmingensis]|uniref:A24 family peptidase n=1 Tax=Streptomyces kunmingensis TaxID=68225 RepID=UPI002D76B92E|nr:A24 family peptidase [Streptomyces kunmingensis]
MLCAVLAQATGRHPELITWLVLAPPALLLALVDARVHRLPDVLTLPLAAVTLLLLGLASVMPAARGSWLGACSGSVGLAAVFLVIFLLSPRAMGFGDVKLALTVGGALGWYGWRVMLLGVFAVYVIAAAHGTILVACRKATGTTALPFGPPLLLGALLGVTIGAALP